jgi:hypothetical protein
VEMAASSSRWCDAAALVSAAGFSAIFGGITFPDSRCWFYGMRQ